MNPISAEARASLAPTGALRAALNLANYLLVGKDPSNGEPRGVAVDLAEALGQRAGVPVELVGYSSPVLLAEGVSSGAWDIAFIAAEPGRATEIEFTAAYLEVEATYLVPAGSTLRSVADADREGVRIASFGGSAYDLYLGRTIKHATIVRSESIPASFERFVAERLDALAGLRPRLVVDTAKLPGSRVLDDRFTAIQQAIAVPKGRAAALGFLREFVEEAKASGLVERLLERHGVRGVTIAPAKMGSE